MLNAHKTCFLNIIYFIHVVFEWTNVQSGQSNKLFNVYATHLKRHCRELQHAFTKLKGFSGQEFVSQIYRKS